VYPTRRWFCKNLSGRPLQRGKRLPVHFSSPTLETFVRYMHEQGLIPEPMALETLFPESTQRTFRV
jgi:hypothetical protein